MMTFDPTTNRIQFCHLTPEERVALEGWPHGWQYFSDGWKDCPFPSFAGYRIYRGKPAPVVTSVWINIYPASALQTYRSRHNADLAAGPSRISVIRIDTCNGVSTAHLEGLE